MTDLTDGQKAHVEKLKADKERLLEELFGPDEPGVEVVDISDQMQPVSYVNGERLLSARSSL